jgi:hypothetical protein
MPSDDEVTEATKAADEAESRAKHEADRPATKDELAAAERSQAVSEDQKEVAKHFEEMTDIGAHVKGEGEIK